MSQMVVTAGKICTLEVRCPCGECFGNVEAYLQHKEQCGIHRGKENVICTPTSIDRNAVIVPATALNSASTRKLAASQAVESDLYAASISRPRDYHSYTAETMKTRIQCSCGQSFAKEKLLKKHLRCSKTHLAEKHRFEPRSKAKSLASVPSTAPLSLPTSVPAAYTSIQEKIPPAMFSIAPSAQKKTEADSLITALESLNLGSVPARARISEASLVCMCGITFTDQEALEQHKRNAGRLAWQGKTRTTAEAFNTPRPQYHKDDYLQEMSIALARQRFVAD